MTPAGGIGNGVGITPSFNAASAGSTPAVGAAPTAAPAPPSAITSSTNPLAPSPQQAALAADDLGKLGLVMISVPPRMPHEAPLTAPKRAAARFEQPRRQEGGASPIASSSIREAAVGADALGTPPSEAEGFEGHGSSQGTAGAESLPEAADLVAFTRTPRGEIVYLERSRWDDQIKQSHMQNPPSARGKRTTTWWPVTYSATGYQTMSEQQVVAAIMDAARHGIWQNAPKGTRLAVYALPEHQAQRFGVSEVNVSTAPDGRILSAYPTRGSNVLAVREAGS